MKGRILPAILVALALATPAATRAALVQTLNPGDSVPAGGSYLSATTKLPVPGDQFDVVSSVSDSQLSVGFSTPMMILDVPDGWDTWSSPPFSEDSMPRVLWTQGPSQVTLSLSTGVQIFGFEAQPDTKNILIDITAEFFSNGTSIGTFTRSVDGNAGARLFAGSVTDPTGLITSVRISTGGQDFGIAQLRYALPGGPVVPEPATLLSGLIGVLLVGGAASRRRRRVPPL